MTKYNILLFLILVFIFPIQSFSQSCEEDLADCRETLRQLVDVTHFSKETNSKDFVDWWKSKWTHGRPLGIIRVDYKLNLLKPVKEEDGYKIYTLPDDGDISIILEVPLPKPGQTDTDSCNSNKSKLKVSKGDTGLLIDLNPYCDESYGPDEVDIALYWISIKQKPIVEIGTNGPACVPVMLYIYNKEKGKYELAAEQCGG
jgi:hypothetical protein